MCGCYPGWPCGTHERQQDEAIANLRARLTGTQYREGEGKVTFTRTDGRTVTIDNVRVDSIGPGAMTHGVVGVERFDTDEIVHVPFVETWEVTY